MKKAKWSAEMQKYGAFLCNRKRQTRNIRWCVLVTCLPIILKRQKHWKRSVFNAFCGAGNRTWTCTEGTRLEPESSASANSAIPAYLIFASDFYTVRQPRWSLLSDESYFSTWSTDIKTQKCDFIKSFNEVALPESSASANSAIPAYWLMQRVFYIETLDLSS